MIRGIRDAAITLFFSLALGAALPAAAIANEAGDFNAALPDGQEASLSIEQVADSSDALLEEEPDSNQTVDENIPCSDEPEAGTVTSGLASDGNTGAAQEEALADNVETPEAPGEDLSSAASANLQTSGSLEPLAIPSTEEASEIEPENEPGDNEEPEVQQPGWEVVDGKTYYRDEAGEHVHGLQNIDGYLYYFDPSTGAALTGWQVIDKKTYHFDPTTCRATVYGKELIGTDNKEHYYYFSGAGVMHTGWLTWTKDNTRSLFAQNSNYIPTGAAFTGWVITGGKTYYFRPTDYRAARYSNKLHGRDGNQRNYYFNGAGAMQTGFVTFGDGTKSYYDPEAGKTYGAAVTGWKTISGKTYYFQPTNLRAARWTQNGIIGPDKKEHDYYFNSQGAMMTNVIIWNKGDARLYGSNGERVLGGWATIGDDKYYVRNGELVQYRQTIGGNRYYFVGNTRKMFRGWLYFSSESIWAYFDETTGVETTRLKVDIGADTIRTIEKYLGWAVDIANDESHGYSQYTRWGPDYDCSSLVISALRAAGLATGSASYTGDMRSNLTARGWVWMTDLSKIRRGDILLNEQTHTAFYLGNGKQLAARIAETGGIHGRTGDQTGREICIHDYVASKWHDGFLRLV